MLKLEHSLLLIILFGEFARSSNSNFALANWCENHKVSNHGVPGEVEQVGGGRGGGGADKAALLT